MDFTAVRANLHSVEDEVARIQAAEGLSTAVRIVGVTKGHPLEMVHTAVAAGITDVGENRVQEAIAKQDVATDLTVNWHLIGHLQTNKAKHVPGRFQMVHSVDSLRIAEALGAVLAKRSEGDSHIELLIQVNVGKESQKSGCAPETAGEIAAYIAETPGLSGRGLMTMAPFVSDEGIQRKVFAELRILGERLAQQGFEMPELSMGMSNDYRAAVAEGATILRLGTVLFGDRAR